jgi:CRISPR system Cascade subunit CasA
MNQRFSLVNDSWLKVLDSQTGETRSVSLIELFEHAQDFRQLAGEMKTQDFAIMRLLLAIITTVYSRYNASDQPYEWLSTDDSNMQIVGEVEDADTDDLQSTWVQLYAQGKFSNAVVNYLRLNADKFEFFGDAPFFQATTEQYDSLVAEKKYVKTGAGTVPIRQINRLVSESNNTPAVFAPKTAGSKDKLEIPELVRWLITYQNFTGVTEKSKVDTKEKFSKPTGWSYQMTPVYAVGNNLFETLMLNYIAINLDDEQVYEVQKPIWEYPSFVDYVNERKRTILPTNLAELYTMISRMIHIEWSKAGTPTIFSAGMPMPENVEAYIEPMTTWRFDKNAKSAVWKPARPTRMALGVAMWRNFGQYVNAYKGLKNEDTQREPGIVQWLRHLQEDGEAEDYDYMMEEQPVILATVNFISDGNSSSQLPAVELTDDMTINADVLFDEKNQMEWPARIADTVDLTKRIGTDYWWLMKNVAKIRNISNSDFASREQGKFYARLNEPFRAWLSGLTNTDDRDEKINDWKSTLKQLVLNSADDFAKELTPRDKKGISVEGKGGEVQLLNFFTAYNSFRRGIYRDLSGKEG